MEEPISEKDYRLLMEIEAEQRLRKIFEQFLEARILSDRQRLLDQLQRESWFHFYTMKDN